LFLEIKLENGLSHDRNRWEKIRKDTKRYRKMGKDGGPIGERGFSCDAANAGVLLNRWFPLPMRAVAHVRVVFVCGLRLFVV